MKITLKAIKKIWSSADQSASLFIFSDKEQKYRVFIKGFNVEEGLKYNLEIKPSNTYENSYVCESLEFLDIIKKDEIIDFLHTKIKGVTKKEAEKIFEDYPIDTLDSILKDPSKLRIKDKKKEEFLADLKLKIDGLEYKKYGIYNLFEKIKKLETKEPESQKLKNFYENPYSILSEDDFDFNEIDTYFLKILKKPVDDPERLRSIILNCFKELYSTNSTKFAIQDIYKQSCKKIAFKKSDFTFFLNDLIKQRKIILLKDKQFLAEAKMYDKEFFIVEKLKRLSKKRYSFNFNFEDKELSKEQKEAATLCLKNSVSILTGYPGSGKTKTLKSILESIISDENKKVKKSNIAIMAPTGKAALQIFEKTGFEAKTIHSFLKLKPKATEVSFFDVDFDHIEILVIDEFSMVTVDLFFLILSTLSSIKKIIIVGDHRQLPAIGAGNLLEDLLELQNISINRLSQIFRNKTKDISENFLNVQKKIPFENNSENVNFIEANDTNFFDKISKLYFEDLSNYDVLEKTILIPFNKFETGAHKTNLHIQKKLFKKNDLKNFAIGDKVMQIENNYEKGVYNGEIGIIEKFVEKVKDKDKEVYINFGDKKINYSLEELNKNISLAYATTVHKFQGSESKIVIFVIFPILMNFLTRKMIYTAFSRAVDKLYIIGSKSALNEVIMFSKDKKILTNISDFIKQSNNENIN